MVFIDGTVVNVALPAIQNTLAAPLAALQWVVNGYFVPLAALLLIGGAASDRFGRRRVFALGVLLFALASMGCGLADSAAALVSARALQGGAGALLVPGSLALIAAAFPAGERGRAIGTWASFTAMATALGPLLGGWLVDQVSWRAVFFINLPLALLTLIIIFTRIRESRASGYLPPIDWVGAVLVSGGLAALIYALSVAENRGWDASVVPPLLTLAVVVLALFILVEQRVAAPMVPLALFRARTFAGANLMTLLLYAALSATMFFLPLNLIHMQHYPATAVGAAFLPFTVTMATLSRWSGRLIDRYGQRAPLIAGPAIAACGCALLAWTGAAGGYWRGVFPGIAVLGLGMTVTVSPLSTTVMNAVAEHQVGLASGINNAVSRVAMVLAIAILGLVALNIFQQQLALRLAAAGLPSGATRALLSEAHKFADLTPSAVVPAALRPAVRTAIDAAFFASYSSVMLVAAALAGASALCAAVVIPTVSGKAGGGRL